MAYNEENAEARFRPLMSNWPVRRACRMGSSGVRQMPRFCFRERLWREDDQYRGRNRRQTRAARRRRAFTRTCRRWSEKRRIGA